MGYFLLYVLLCLLVGLAGKNQPFGFIGYAFMSFFLTPVVAVAILLVLTLHTRAALKKKEAQGQSNE